MKWNKTVVYLVAGILTLGIGLGHVGASEPNTMATGGIPISSKMPTTKGAANDQVFTTVDGQTVTLPVGVKSRDLKHVAMSKGYINGAGQFQRTESYTGNALATGMTPAVYNEVLSEGIRTLAGADRLDIPELQTFHADVWRDWNVHQWTKTDNKGWHSAYVVEVAISPQYLEFGKAWLELNDKGKAQATPEKPFDMQTAFMESVETRLVSAAPNPEKAAADLKQRREMQSLMTNVQSVQASWLDELSDNRSFYTDTTYSAERDYARLEKAFNEKSGTETAENLNKKVRAYKSQLAMALAKDLANNRVYLGPNSVRSGPSLAEEKALTDTTVNFIMDSDLIVDNITERLVHTKFGKGQYTELRVGMIIDGFEIPMTLFGIAYYTDNGPVINFIMVNDSDYATWQPIVNYVWGIQ